MTEKTIQDLWGAFEELKGSLRRGPKTPRRDDDEPDSKDRSAMQRRIDELTRQRNEAEEKLAKAIEAGTELKGRFEAELKTVRESAAADVARGIKTVNENHELRALMHEPDEDAVSVARQKYDAIEPAKRPASILDWWRGLDDESTPKTLRSYRPPADDADKKAPAQDKPARQVPRVDAAKKPVKEVDPSSLDEAGYEKWLQEQGRLARQR